jgi:hypothetical protein
MDLKVGDGTMRVHFNDWMFLQPSGVLLNRARVTKLGFKLGEVTLAFMKPDARETAMRGVLSPLPGVGVLKRAASR